MDNKDKKQNKAGEINTTYPMEFPAKKTNEENHIAETVVNVINPPKATNDVQLSK